MRVRGVEKDPDKIELNMTPMIDIVFQLLTFFIMSLKITAAEGDFSIKMPLAAARPAIDEHAQVLFRLRLTAHADGALAGVRLDGAPLAREIRGPADAEAAFAALSREMIARLGDERGPGSVASAAAVRLDCDDELDYEHAIAAITAVSGQVSRDRERFVTKLIEKIEFAPRRPADL